ncbi:MAG: hypothetical protein Ct9H300mP27_05120 [Chloroflexota bacterium]|nr:MAG: hypothetical protein Ct9H300mP27_05120 [Chloroflexota bacterium]
MAFKKTERINGGQLIRYQREDWSLIASALGGWSKKIERL